MSFGVSMPKVQSNASAPRVRHSPLTARLYTDGSHIKGTPRRGWGAVLFFEGRNYRMSGVADPRQDPAAASNPTMELRAAATALERLHEVRPVSLVRLEVLADYVGVREYGNGRWRAAKSKVAHFRAEAQRLQQAAAAIRGAGVALEFRHVRGHSGNLGNDMADELARSGLTRDTFGELKEAK